MNSLYSSLPLTTPNAIRILGLHPGKDSSPLMTSLRVISVDDTETQYDALSYTWGSREHQQEIICNGQPVNIMRNLYSYLFRDRSTIPLDKVHWIWVDAVCINQSDLDERASQIKLMLQIFQKAREVRADLGDAPEDIFMMFDLMHKLEKVLSDHYNDDEQFYHTDFEALGLPPIDSRPWQLWQEVLSRPYFTRAWVVSF
jgi:hypothetical protein